MDMKKLTHPGRRSPKPLRTVDAPALELVRGGTTSLPPPAISASDDWEAPVV
jgi:hypothetical protein